MKPNYTKAVIAGAGTGLSASLARLFAAGGLEVALAARSTNKLAALAAETGAGVHACDSADHSQVAALFAALDRDGAPDVVVYNPSARVRGPFVDLDPGGGAVSAGDGDRGALRRPGGGEADAAGGA